MRQKVKEGRGQLGDPGRNALTDMVEGVFKHLEKKNFQEARTRPYLGIVFLREALKS